MLHHNPRPLLLLLALIAFVVVLLAPSPAPAQTVRNNKVYLPLLAGGAGAGTQSVFGLEMLNLGAHRGLDLVTATDTRWVRRNAVLWKEIEPTQGSSYNWGALWSLEEELIRASQLGINLVVIVRGSPQWAVSPHTADCAPINPRHYGDFARFMAALVQRYSGPPYNLRYIEIGNEPDAPVFTSDSVFGCWGDERDPYFGGGAYGEMLKVVVPAMKAANPAVQVLNGGLLLDQPFDESNPKTRLGRFFEGVLRAGAGPYIDIVSFHSYTFWRSQPPLGPSVDWRVDYIRKLLAAYGQSAKPLLRTEAALLCVEVTPECRWGQADLVARTYARTMRDQLLGTIWYIYDDDGFHNTAMIEPYDVFVPRPAYFAYRHTAAMFSGAAYDGSIPGLPPGVEGYQFQKSGGRVYVFWTDEPAPVPFSLAIPAGASASCTDRDGGALPCAPQNAVLNLVAETSPAFVELR